MALLPLGVTWPAGDTGMAEPIAAVITRQSLNQRGITCQPAIAALTPNRHVFKRGRAAIAAGMWLDGLRSMRWWQERPPPTHTADRDPLSTG